MNSKIPLTDGAFYVDNSMLSTLKCPRLWEYQHSRKLVPSSFAPALNFGSAIHLALEHRARHHEPMLDRQQCESEQTDILAEFFAENPPPEDDHRGLNFAVEVIKQYNERYEIEPYNLLLDEKGEKMVEFSFAVPLFTYQPPSQKAGDDRMNIPVVYTGRLDLPTMWDGKLILVDNKTKGQLGAKVFDEFRMSPQMLGYCWAFQKATGKMPHGFAINFIRTKEPTMKMLDGTESKANIKKWWDSSFYREKEFISQWSIDEWERNAIARVKELFYYDEQQYFPMKQYHCVDYGRCPFYDVCYYSPSVREELLASNAFKTNDWSPLNSDKVKP